MKEKKTNPEISEFVEFYHDLYQQKKGIKYDWQKKDFGNLPKCLDYFKDQGGIEKMREAASLFLDSNDKFISGRGWCISDFLTSPGKWLIELNRILEAKKRQDATKAAIQSNYAENKNRRFLDRELHDAHWQKKNIDEFVSRQISEASKDPEAYFRRFLLTEHMLKQRNETLWKRTCAELAELVGKDRAREMWKNRQPILKTF